MEEIDDPFLSSHLPSLALHLELGTCGTFLCTSACQLVLSLCQAMKPMNHNKDQDAKIYPMVQEWNFILGINDICIIGLKAHLM